MRKSARIAMSLALAIPLTGTAANAQGRPQGAMSEQSARSQLATCIARVDELQRENHGLQQQAGDCAISRAPNGVVGLHVAGASLVNGNWVCLPIMRHGRLREQVPVRYRFALPNGTHANGFTCGTPHPARPRTAPAVDEAFVAGAARRAIEPFVDRIGRLEQRVERVERRVTSVEERVQRTEQQIAELRRAVQAACQRIAAQARSGDPQSADLVAQCATFNVDLQRESATLTNAQQANAGAGGTTGAPPAAAASGLNLGDVADLVEANVRNLQARVDGWLDQVYRRLPAIELVNGIGVSTPLLGSQSTGFTRTGIRFRTPIAGSSTWAFTAQGEAGVGYGGLGESVAMGGRLGFVYQPNETVGIGFGVSGRNFWNAWQQLPGVQGVNRGWNGGGFLSLPIRLGTPRVSRVTFEPFAEIGVGHALGRTAQGQFDETIGPAFVGGMDLVIRMSQ